ncbi:MAG: cysteine desulfurase-like protein [Actinomycetota bacterium]|nr:cysteine desulfurase-like protein [Actinomycetota bacterium]
MSPQDSPLDIEHLRKRFPALASRHGDVFVDSPGGTQVPAEVIDAMASYLERNNANAGGAFATSAATDQVISGARRAAADLLGCSPDEVVFGPNMTTLSLSLSRSIARTLGPGDEVIVTRLDHDANIAPWLAAAEDRGAAVKWVDIDPSDCTLDLRSLEEALNPSTRVVAFTLASNATGTITDAGRVVELARTTSALVVADAVHFAPHRLIDVTSLDIDVLLCSPYKFFGPHLGVMFGRRSLLEKLEPYKVRPASDEVPHRFETGTLSHEALAGFTAAVDYLGGLVGGPAPDRRAGLAAGMTAVSEHEKALTGLFLDRIEAIPGVRLYGISGRDRLDERTPTFALTVEGVTPRDAASELGRRGIYAWDGNYYALAVMERLGLQGSGGALRIGFCHLNTPEEVERVGAELARLA